MLSGFPVAGSSSLGREVINTSCPAHGIPAASQICQYIRNACNAPQLESRLNQPSCAVCTVSYRYCWRQGTGCNQRAMDIPSTGFNGRVSGFVHVYVCPRCGSDVYRIPRRFADRLVSIFMTVHRYACNSSGCDWEGCLRVKRNTPPYEWGSDQYNGRIHVLGSSRMGDAKGSGKLPR